MLVITSDTGRLLAQISCGVDVALTTTLAYTDATLFGDADRSSRPSYPNIKRVSLVLRRRALFD
jgi:hypothetical protein